MKTGIVIYSADAETVWNAFRFANFAVSMGDEVRVFLVGGGVETVKPASLSTDAFNVAEHVQTFIHNGGNVFACGTCLDIHHLKAAPGFSVATLKDLYEIVQGSDKVLTF